MEMKISKNVEKLTAMSLAGLDKGKVGADKGA